VVGGGWGLWVGGGCWFVFGGGGGGGGGGFGVRGGPFKKSQKKMQTKLKKSSGKTKHTPLKKKVRNSPQATSVYQYAKRNQCQRKP